MEKPSVSIQKIKRLYEWGFGTFDPGLSVFGFRDEDNYQYDGFNDWIGICLEDQNKIALFAGTTDPGTYYTENPFTVEGITGAAHLINGFHKEIWTVGIHAQKTSFAHEALVQYGNVAAVWRDVHKDYRQHSDDPVQTGYFGINLHHANPASKVDKIGGYSAGCQVIQDPRDFAEFMALLKSSSRYLSNPKTKISYLLLDKSAVG